MSLWNHRVPNIGPKIHTLLRSLLTEVWDRWNCIPFPYQHPHTPPTPQKTYRVIISRLPSSRCCCPACGSYKPVIHLFPDDMCVIPGPFPVLVLPCFPRHITDVMDSMFSRPLSQEPKCFYYVFDVIVFL